MHYFKHISEKIENLSFSFPDSLYDPVRYILSLGGKKFRPLLYDVTCRSFGSTSNDYLALTLEVFHNFTLMHDDVMDHADVRRSKPTVHKKWNVSTAILSGDVMLIEAYDCIEKLEDNAQKLVAFKWFNKVAREVCQGQQLDLDYEKYSKVSMGEYLNMIKLKTGVLIGLSMVFAGITSKQPDDVLRRLYELGTQIGLLFQIQDDYLDAFGTQEKTGKQVGGDILEGKKAYPYIKAISKTTNAEHLIELYHSTHDQKVPLVLSEFSKLNIQQAVQQDIQERYQALIQMIEKFNPFKDKTLLLELLNSLYYREN